jgi:hypothetical protein
MLPGSDTEIVLATEHDYAPNWLVASADEAAQVIVSAGGQVVTGPFDIRAVVAADPFGNVLVLLDLSKGTYRNRQHRPGHRPGQAGRLIACRQTQPAGSSTSWRRK